MSPRKSKAIKKAGTKPVDDKKPAESAVKLENTPVRSTLRLKIIIAAVLTMLCALALFIRVYPSYDKVFSPVGIKFTSNDSYFFMRLVDNLVHNFPHHTFVDPYLIYPNNSGVVQINFFVWLLAIPAWIAGFGSASQHTIDVIAAYIPAVMGAFIVVPVYFIGKELSSRWAGILSAALIAIIPGEFLGRSILGFTDNHIAETFFTTIAMLFLILAIKTAHRRQLTLRHIRQRDWVVTRKPLVYSLLAGLVMGLYMFTWLGALLFIFMAFLYFVVQFIIDHLKHKSTDYLCIVGVIFFGIALLTSLLITSGLMYIAALLIATLAMPALNGLSRLMMGATDEIPKRMENKYVNYFLIIMVVISFIVLIRRLLTDNNITATIIFMLLILPVIGIIYELFAGKRIKPIFFPLAIVGVSVGVIGVLFLINRPLFETMIDALRIFKPSGTDLTTIEMQPIISKIYGNRLAIVWGNFNIAFFLSFFSLAILIYTVIKNDAPEKGLLVVWSLVILAATLGQRRFGYYLAVNVTLLTGYLCWRLLEIVKKRHAEITIICIWLAAMSFIGGMLYAFVKSGGQRSLLGYVFIADLILLALYILIRVLQLGGLLTLNSDQTNVSGIRGAGRIHRGRQSTPGSPKYLLFGIAIFVILQVVYAPSILFPNPKDAPANAVASNTPYAPSDAWVSSMDWLKENSPDPFNDPQVYYQIQKKAPGETFYQFPESAYGVLSWWDYGYWITRIAHRIPNANPSQDPVANKDVAQFFVSQDESAAEGIRQKLGSKYIVIDDETTISKFWAIITWAGKQPSDYFDVYLVPQQQQGQTQITYKQALLYYPEYYRSMAVRLFNFEGKAVTPDNVLVISYRQQNDNAGNVYKVLSDFKQFPALDEAQAFISGNTTGNWKIIGTNPMKAAIPLEALAQYKLNHGSEQTSALQDGMTTSSVKIFEYANK